MNYLQVIHDDLLNGKGNRTSIFISGCERHCAGCFNPESWDFNAGRKFSRTVFYRMMKNIKDNPLNRGFTILGGEPLHPNNVEDVLDLILKFKGYLERNLSSSDYKKKNNIWIYTGYTWSQLKKRKDYDVVKQVLENINVLVDGPFRENKKDLSLEFRGSSNQRIIDAKKSLKENKVILFALKNSKKVK